MRVIAINYASKGLKFAQMGVGVDDSDKYPIGNALEHSMYHGIM